MLSEATAAYFPAEKPLSTGSRLRLLFASFPFWLALRFAVLLICKRIFSPESSLNFSQTGEDAVIRSLLDEHQPGVYIDVGCHDPIKTSNTLSLYLHGWWGIAIDANESLMRRYRATRRRDIAVCAAVSDEEREMVFHEFDFELVNTLSDEVLDEWRSKWPERRQRVVTTRRLDSILAEYLPPRTEISLLSVDVEGHDLNVLRSIDLNRYRPKLIVVEIHHFQLADAAQHPLTRYLAEAEFQLIGYDGLNGYFLDHHSRRSGLLPR